MMWRWKVEDAKSRFSELVSSAVREGPQMVTKRGEETVVVVPVEQWRRMSASPYPTLKDWLLAPEPRFDLPLPPRRRSGRRRKIEIE